MHQLRGNGAAMNPSGPKPTMREIAAHLGISHATVSRALRDDPRISAAQRLKVQKEARRLGYKRDPKIAELMSHLRMAKRRVFQGTLAWVTNLDPDDPQMKELISQFHPHANTAAEAMGYRLDPFFKVTPAEAPKLARTFKARGIVGVWASIFWQVDYREWKWDWQQFAFIHHGAEPKRRIVNVVDAEDRQNIQHLFDSLAGRGLPAHRSRHHGSSRTGGTLRAVCRPGKIRAPEPGTSGV
jgi:DNA-binding LacI/PurR family transcriptional regulator